MSRVRPHLLMGDRGIKNFRLLIGSAIEACPALFPCKNALPARNRLGVAQDTSLKSHAWLEQGQKSLVLKT